MDAINLSHVWPNFPATSAVTTKAPRYVPAPRRRLEELVTAQAGPSLQDRLLAEAVTAALGRRVFEQWQAFEQERAQKVWATQTAALLAEV